MPAHRLIPLVLLFGGPGCAALVEEPVDEEEPWTIEALWTSPPPDGTWVRLDDVVVTSPRTADRTAFTVQDPLAGPRSGLLVLVRGELPDWPPPIGTPVSLLGPILDTAEGPALELMAGRGEMLGSPEPTAVVEWTADPELAYALVTAGTVTLTSNADPLGQADTDAGVGLSGAFGVPAPGFGNAGTLSGIAMPFDRISPRVIADWTGPLAGAPLVQTTVAALRAGDWPDGTPVLIRGVVQGTPWSLDGRYMLAQDDEACGLWVDVEGFVRPETARGDVLDIAGEVRSDGEGLRLRSWSLPTSMGVGTPFVGWARADGCLVDGSWHDLSGPDAWGIWTASDGTRIAPRFTGLDELSGDLHTEAALRVDAQGTVTAYPLTIP